MKFAFLILLGSVVISPAETLIISAGTNTVLSVPQGEAIFFGRHYVDPTPPSSAPWMWLVAFGRTNSWRPSGYLSAIAGPVDLIFSGGGAHLFRIKRMQTTNIHTRFFYPGEPPQQINVASNETIFFFGPIPVFDYGSAVFKRGNQSFRGATIQHGDEFEGPLTIEIDFQDSENVRVVSYILNREFTELPQQAAVTTPPGRHSFVIEKSSNLTSWTPVFQQIVTQNDKAFYRFRIDP